MVERSWVKTILSSFFLPFFPLLYYTKDGDTMKIKESLQNYIEKEIFPQYQKNDQGHNLEHITYVIDRSLKFAQTISNINYDMVYTIAAFHDIGHALDPKNHEKISGDRLASDEVIKKFFTEEQIAIMVEAIYDHRASKEGDPETIYGKILASADKNTSVESSLQRTYAYRKKNYPNLSLEETIEESRRHLIQKFGKQGYANSKMYFEDKAYQQYLEEIGRLVQDKEEFEKQYKKINHL